MKRIIIFLFFWALEYNSYAAIGDTSAIRQSVEEFEKFVASRLDSSAKYNNDPLKYYFNYEQKGGEGYPYFDTKFINGGTIKFNPDDLDFANAMADVKKANESPESKEMVFVFHGRYFFEYDEGVVNKDGAFNNPATTLKSIIEKSNEKGMDEFRENNDLDDINYTFLSSELLKSTKEKINRLTNGRQYIIIFLIEAVTIANADNKSVTGLPYDAYRCNYIALANNSEENDQKTKWQNLRGIINHTTGKSVANDDKQYLIHCIHNVLDVQKEGLVRDEDKIPTGEHLLEFKEETADELVAVLKKKYALPLASAPGNEGYDNFKHIYYEQIEWGQGFKKEYLKMLEYKLTYLQKKTGVEMYVLAKKMPVVVGSTFRPGQEDYEKYDALAQKVLNESKHTGKKTVVVLLLQAYEPYELKKFNAVGASTYYMIGIASDDGTGKALLEKGSLSRMGGAFDMAVGAYKNIEKPYTGYYYYFKADGTVVEQVKKADKPVRGMGAIDEVVVCSDEVGIAQLDALKPAKNCSYTTTSPTTFIPTTTYFPCDEDMREYMKKRQQLLEKLNAKSFAEYTYLPSELKEEYAEKLGRAYAEYAAKKGFKKFWNNAEIYFGKHDAIKESNLYYFDGDVVVYSGFDALSMIPVIGLLGDAGGAIYATSRAQFTTAASYAGFILLTLGTEGIPFAKWAAKAEKGAVFLVKAGKEIYYFNKGDEIYKYLLKNRYGGLADNVVENLLKHENCDLLLHEDVISHFATKFQQQGYKGSKEADLLAFISNTASGTLAFDVAVKTSKAYTNIMRYGKLADKQMENLLKVFKSAGADANACQEILQHLDEIEDVTLLTGKVVDGKFVEGKFLEDVLEKYPFFQKDFAKEPGLIKVWAELRQNPEAAAEIIADASGKYNFSSRFSKWLDWQEIKVFLEYGKKFEEDVCLVAFKNRKSAEYAKLKDAFVKDFSKNLDEYDMYSQVQLIYNDKTGDYFIADQLFVKYKIDAAGKQIVDDIIVVENKLSEKTALTVPQRSAKTINSYKVRSVQAESQYAKGAFVKQGSTLNFSTNTQWYKVYDGEKGTVIKGIEKL